MKISSVIGRIVNLLKRKPKLHFIHVGKTGGSAIAFALKGHAHKYNYHIKFHDHKTKLTDIPAGEKFFFCVRDPIDRFVSGFYSRQRQGRPRYNSPWRKEEKAAFSKFKTSNELALALSSTDETYKAEAEYAMNTIAHVKSSYWDWFIEESYLKKRVPDILYICNQHKLKEDFNELKVLLGLPDHLELPEKDSTAAHRNPGGLDRALAAQARLNLESWYDAEYYFLNLIKEIQSRN